VVPLLTTYRTRENLEQTTRLRLTHGIEPFVLIGLQLAYQFIAVFIFFSDVDRHRFDADPDPTSILMGTRIRILPQVLHRLENSIFSYSYICASLRWFIFLMSVLGVIRYFSIFWPVYLNFMDQVPVRYSLGFGRNAYGPGSVNQIGIPQALNADPNSKK
jgi:hypothetical protein